MYLKHNVVKSAAILLCDECGPREGELGSFRAELRFGTQGLRERRRQSAGGATSLDWSVGVCAPPSVPPYCGSLTVKVSGDLLHTH